MRGNHGVVGVRQTRPMSTPPGDSRVRAARLAAHGFGGGLPTIADAVRRLAAVQAQDFTAAKWVVGSRVPGSVAADVDAALESREIVRSWPLRGTLHLLPSEHLRAILAITGPREVQRSALRRRQLELDDETFRRARAIVEGQLAGGRSLSRDELQTVWQASGIATAGQRGYHLIWRLAVEGVLCWGPIEVRGQRLVLLDEWIPPGRGRFDRDETLATLFLAYVTGHGPATVRDFAWWSGLTLGDARTAHAAAGDMVTAFDDTRLVAADAGWAADPASPAPRPRGGLALAAFDEYFLGYVDRDAVCDPAHAERVVPGRNGVFQPILVSAGRVVGTWKRGPRRKLTSVQVAGFSGATAVSPSTFRASLSAWARFWGDTLDDIEVV